MSRLETVISDLAARHYRRLEISRQPCEDLVRASVRTSDWALCFQVSPYAELRLRALGMDARKQDLLAKGLVHHELGHWSVCPFDSEGEFIITRAVSEVLNECRFLEGLTPESMENLIGFFSNLTADLIVDTVLSFAGDDSDYADGQALFVSKELKRAAAAGSHNAIFEMFTHINLALWGRRTRLGQRLSELLGHRPGILKPEIFGRLFPEFQNPLQIPAALRNRTNWPHLAKALTRLLVRLLPDPVRIPAWWRPSPFRRVMTVLYEGRASAVALQTVEENAGVVQRWPVTGLLHRSVDPLESPQPETICWERSSILPLHRRAPALQLEQTMLYMDTPSASSGPGTLLPDLAFVIDSSGSMEYKPYEGRGQYDLLLRAVFGVFHWLQANSLGWLLNYAVVNFSDKTVSSGWRGWSRRHALHDALFDYQGSSTHLNVDTLRSLKSRSKRPFTVVMITDGELANTAEVLAYTRYEITPPHGLILLQIGRMTGFAKQVQRMGFSVHRVDQPADLPQLVLGAVKKRMNL